MIPLHYLNVAAYFDEALYFPLMKSLLSGMGSEALCVQVNTIQWCFYYKNEIVCDYVDRIESDPLTHELLVQIYFYGIKGTPASKECEKRFEKILSLDNEEIIAKLIEAAMMAYEHAEYRDLSKKFLNIMRLTIGKRLLMPIVCIVLLFRRRPSIGIVVLPRYMQEKVSTDSF